MHGCGQHRRRCRLICARLEPHAQFTQQTFGVGQHVHQVRNRRALIAPNVTHAVFQQRLGDRKDAFTGKGFPRAKPQMFHFRFK